MLKSLGYQTCLTKYMLSMFCFQFNMAQLEARSAIIHCVQLLDTYSPDDIAMEEHFFNYMESDVQVTREMITVKKIKHIIDIDIIYGI